MLFLLYHCLALCCFPFLLIFAVLHILFKPRYALFYLQRFSLVLPRSTPRTRRRVWIHAVSVGEVLSCAPLIQRLQKNDFAVYLSTGTEFGFQAAKKKYAGVEFFYFPFDIFFVTNRFIKRIDPDIVLLCELEIWPAFVRCVYKRGVPLYLISGRLVKRDFRLYRIFKWFFKSVFSIFSGLFMQTESYARRMRQLSDRDDIKALGNLKFDVTPESIPDKMGMFLPEGFNLCAVSTHRGDEWLIIRVFQSLRIEFPQLRLVLVPRHPHRRPEIVRILEKQRLSYTLRSEKKHCTTPVFIVDTIGEMMGVYEKCDIVILGGSFSEKVGGHNIIEPALYRKCILCGNHMENFEDIYALFKQEHALVSTNRDSLMEDLKTLILDKSKTVRIGERAFRVIIKNRGVSERIYSEIFNRIPADSQADPEKSMYFALGR